MGVKSDRYMTPNRFAGPDAGDTIRAMKKSIGGLAGFVLATFAANVFGVEKLPAEAFARAKDFEQVRLAPDGKYAAFVREFEERPTLYLADLETLNVRRVNPGISTASHDRMGVNDVTWVSDRRVAFSTFEMDHYLHGMTAVDRDGAHVSHITGLDAKNRLFATEILHTFHDARHSVLVLDYYSTHADRLHPHVEFLDTLSGGHRQVMRNPGNVIDWGVDHAGVVRLGVTADGLNFGVTYRAQENAPWRVIATNGRIWPLTFDADDRRLFVSALSPKQRWAVFPLDPTTGELGESLADDADYDIVPDGYTPRVDGIPLAGPWESERTHTLAGVRYVTDGPRVRWFDAGFEACQRDIDGALRGTVNMIVGGTRDEQQLLVLAFSARDPGKYYLFDVAKRKLRLVFACAEWIDPALMAEMFPIKYQARDGLLIHGYLTLPPGLPQKNLPLVVMPHGGPWVRDVWRYDALVQLLANRGYAVLQMNYRGSLGYGRDFSDKGKKQVGRSIQDDIEDGTRWAIAKGIADPARVAIVGASYGGFSALFALGHNPELYRCGVSIAGVTDWPDIIKGRDDDEYRLAYLHWVEQIGDPKNDAEFLKAISPVNYADKIAAPVLIIQGKDDRTVPPKQARAMVTALEKAGRKPESLFVSREGHGFAGQKARLEEFKRIDEFLARHLAAGN